MNNFALIILIVTSFYIIKQIQTVKPDPERIMARELSRIKERDRKIGVNIDTVFYFPLHPKPYVTI